MYHVYNRNSGLHHYTTSLKEHDALVKLGWHDEGIAWWVPSDGPVKVYRLYNPYSGEHVYTTSSNEYAQDAKAGWRQEGVAWKAYPKA